MDTIAAIIFIILLGIIILSIFDEDDNETNYYHRF